MRTIIACAAALLAAALPARAQTSGDDVSASPPAGPRKPKSVVQQEDPVPKEKPSKVKKTQVEEVLGGDLIHMCERPTSTWCPHVCGNAAIVLETGIELASDDGERLNGNTFTLPTVVRYGLSESFELFVLTDALIDRRGDDPATGESVDAFGIGDITLGTKWGLLTDTGALPSIGSIALWKLPTADDDKNLGTGEGDLYFITSAGKHFADDFALYGNLGLGFISDPNESNRFIMRKLASVEARVQFYDITVFGEVVWMSDLDALAGTQTFARAGGAYYITEDLRLDLAFKFGLSEDADDFSVTLGLSVVLGSM